MSKKKWYQVDENLQSSQIPVGDPPESIEDSNGPMFRGQPVKIPETGSSISVGALTIRLNRLK